MKRQKYDQEIQRIAQSGRIPFPRDFNGNIMKLYESLPEGEESTGIVMDRDNIYATDNAEDTERMDHVARHLFSVQ